MPGWVVLIGLAWIVVAVVIIALFRGAALLSGRTGGETRDTPQRDMRTQNDARLSAAPKVGEMLQPSGKARKSNGAANAQSANAQSADVR